jgi:hypothetical protein
MLTVLFAITVLALIGLSLAWLPTLSRKPEPIRIPVESRQHRRRRR